MKKEKQGKSTVDEKNTIKGRNGGTLKKVNKGDPSPNPNGRPKGSKNRSTIFKKWMELSSVGKNPITGQEEDMTIEDRMVLKIIGRVLVDGNVHAFKESMDNLYGTKKEYIDHTSLGEKITIPIIDIPRDMNMDEWKTYIKSDPTKGK